MSAQPLVQIEVVRSDSSVPRGLGAHGPMVSERRLIAFGDAQVTGRRFGGPVPAQELVQISERIRSWERAPGPSGGGFGAVAASGAGPAPSEYVAVQLDSSSGIPSQGQRAVWSADRWLDFAEQRPAAFAAGLSNAGRTSLAEHELWVKSLVRRALETGRLDRIVDALQLSTTADARSLARDFRAEGRKVSAAGSTDSIGRAD
jgi:hypothetical protein